MKVVVKTKPLFLRFPEKLDYEEDCNCNYPQPQPQPTPPPECNCNTEAEPLLDCAPIPLTNSWSLPSAAGNRCESCVLEKPRYASASSSAASFPRRVDCQCSCDQVSDNHKSLTQVIQLKSIQPNAPSDFKVITNFIAHFIFV